MLLKPKPSDIFPSPHILLKNTKCHLERVIEHNLNELNIFPSSQEKILSTKSSGLVGNGEKVKKDNEERVRLNTRKNKKG